MNKLKCSIFYFFVCVTILCGCGQPKKENIDTVSTTSIQPVHTTSKEMSAVEVRWVYMSWPIPSSVVSRPLIGGRDEERIAKILQWVKEAARIDDSDLTSPLHGRSMAMNIELSDGSTLQIRPAWKCDIQKEEQGNTQTTCKSVDNRISVAGLEDGEYFAESEQLYNFVNNGYLDWMPNVKPYEAPDKLKTGAPFSVQGHGTRIDQVTVALMKDNDTIWEKRVMVNGGDWQAEGVIPDDLPEADYEWKIDSGTSKYGASVHISNP